MNIKYRFWLVVAAVCAGVFISYMRLQSLAVDFPSGVLPSSMILSIFILSVCLGIWWRSVSSINLIAAVLRLYAVLGFIALLGAYSGLGFGGYRSSLMSFTLLLFCFATTIAYYRQVKAHTVDRVILEDSSLVSLGIFCIGSIHFVIAIIQHMMLATIAYLAILSLTSLVAAIVPTAISRQDN